MTRSSYDQDYQVFLIEGFSIITSDMQPPRLSCPSNLTLVASRGKSMVYANWPLPSASDNSGLPVTVGQSLLPPVILQEGTYIVSVTATDHRELSTRCQFIITVNGLFIFIMTIAVTFLYIHYPDYTYRVDQSISSSWWPRCPPVAMRIFLV